MPWTRIGEEVDITGKLVDWVQTLNSYFASDKRRYPTLNKEAYYRCYAYALSGMANSVLSDKQTLISLWDVRQPGLMREGVNVLDILDYLAENLGHNFLMKWINPLHDKVLEVTLMNS